MAPALQYNSCNSTFLWALPGAVCLRSGRSFPRCLCSYRRGRARSAPGAPVPGTARAESHAVLSDARSADSPPRSPIPGAQWVTIASDEGIKAMRMQSNNYNTKRPSQQDTITSGS